MSEFRSTGIVIGLAGFGVVVLACIAASFTVVVGLGVAVVGGWMLGVAAMYLDPPPFYKRGGS